MASAAILFSGPLLSLSATVFKGKNKFAGNKPPQSTSSLHEKRLSYMRVETVAQEVFMRISNSSVLLSESQNATDKQSKKKQALEKMRQSWIDFLSNFPEDLSELPSDQKSPSEDTEEKRRSN
jgi:hypothetical protein